MLKKAYLAIKKSFPRILRRLTLFFYIESAILALYYILGSIQNFLTATQIFLLWSLVFTEFILIIIHLIYLTRTVARHGLPLSRKIVLAALQFFLIVYHAIFFIFLNTVLALA